jgi:predicted dithiol-disulfide oxidoreductase (DUF899 family)
MQPRIVSHEEWVAARKQHLEHEREMTQALDRLREERRALPWVKVTKPYVFDAADGKVNLADLFDGRSQLAVYHFMLTPDNDHVCDGCAFIADHIDAARQHFEHADLSFAAVSRAPLSQILPVRERMGWTFRWVSSFGTDFNYDFGVSFTDKQVADRATGYNFGTTDYANPDLPGASIFAKRKDGQVYRTYSTYTRGLELLDGAFNWLDLTPKGRNEGDEAMSWVRLHDEYEQPSGSECCQAKHG